MIIGLLTSSLLILVVLLIRKLCNGHIKAWLQYGLWMLVAIKLIIFPVPWVTSSFAILSPANQVMPAQELSLQTPESQKDSNTAVEGPTYFSASEVKQNYSNAAEKANYISKAEVIRYLKYAGIALWIIGAIVFALRFLVENHMVRKAFLQKRIKYEQDIVPLEVYTVENLASPCLFGGKIYARKEFLEDSKMREHVLIHEYCHHLHRDNIWSVLRCICLVAYWWNPIVWLAARYSKTDCELACDAAAIRKLGEGERINYGRTLINLMPVKGTRYLVLASSMKGSKKSMKDRINVISKKPRSAVSLCFAVTIIVCAVLIFTCIIKPGNDSVSANNTVNNTANNTVKVASTYELKPDTPLEIGSDTFIYYLEYNDKNPSKSKVYLKYNDKVFGLGDADMIVDSYVAAMTDGSYYIFATDRGEDENSIRLAMISGDKCTTSECVNGYLAAADMIKDDTVIMKSRLDLFGTYGATNEYTYRDGSITPCDSVYDIYYVLYGNNLTVKTAFEAVGKDNASLLIPVDAEISPKQVDIANQVLYFDYKGDLCSVKYDGQAFSDHKLNIKGVAVEDLFYEVRYGQ